MALRSKSVILYGLQVTEANRWIDFKSVNGGDEKSVSIPLGYYSLSSLMIAIKAAMQSVDALNSYTVSADRTISGGLENRVTITTAGTHLELLFATGTNAVKSVYSLIGFTGLDHSGSTSYTGNTTAGTMLVPSVVGFEYLSPTRFAKIAGTINTSANGDVETVVFNLQQFLNVRFKYIPESEIDSFWAPWLTWCVYKRSFEFTPEITSPSSFYEVFLESSPEAGNGLGFSIKDMGAQYPGFCDTGLLKFRVKG